MKNRAATARTNSLLRQVNNFYATANTINVIYTVLAVIFLHICVLPITVRISAKIDSDKGRVTFTAKLFFIPIFSKSASIDSDNGGNGADAWGDGEESGEGDKSSHGIKRIFTEYLKNFALTVVKRVRVREMDLTAAIGAGDAAVTATAVGMLKIAYTQACALLNYAGDCGGIRPDYQSEYIFVDYFGIFSLCFADIIYAANAAIVKTVRRGDSKNRRKAHATNLVAERTAGPSD